MASRMAASTELRSLDPVRSAPLPLIDRAAGDRDVHIRQCIAIAGLRAVLCNPLNDFVHIVTRAGILEVVWAYYMKQSHGFTRLVPSAISIVTMIVSFGLLSVSMRTLPLGTAYIVWTGIGAVGAFLVGLIVLEEPANTSRILAAALIVIGLLTMKFSS